MLFGEGQVGSLELGKYADLVMLSADPRAVEPVELWELGMLMTMLGAQSAYFASDSYVQCPQSEGRGGESGTPGSDSTIGAEFGDLAARARPGSVPQNALDGDIEGTAWV